jgi:hypothetical protein
MNTGTIAGIDFRGKYAHMGFSERLRKWICRKIFLILSSTEYNAMRNIFLTVSLFAILSLTCNAQTDSTRSTVTVTYSKIGYKRTVHDKNFHTAVKINPLLIFNGDIPVYVERRLRDKISVEGSVGFTYQDYFNEVILLDGYENYKRYPKPGYSFSGALRYYPSNYTRALDEFYFGPEIRYRRYNSEVEDLSANPATLSRLVEYRTLIDFKMTFGYMAYVADNVMFDIYGGIGIRHRDMRQAKYDYSYSSSTSQLSLESTNDFIPTIAAGVKFGIAF